MRHTLSRLVQHWLENWVSFNLTDEWISVEPAVDTPDQTIQAPCVRCLHETKPVWWSIIRKMCLCLMTVQQTKYIDINMSTNRAFGSLLAHWPWEDPSCHDTPLFLWLSSHMFPIWRTKPLFYVWNGVEHNSADGMWRKETQPDGTPSERLRSQSQTILTETQVIEDSRPYSLTPSFF